jgi:hypothetical protein
MELEVRGQKSEVSPTRHFHDFGFRIADLEMNRAH